MIKPPNLRDGDKVGIIAPAKKVSQADMKMAIQILESWNLDVILGKHLYSSYNQFAGTDEERTQDLQEMIDNPDMSIQLRSYAASTDGSDSSSRRVALGRAIDVRKYLMDRNIRPTRVEVRALGDQTDRLPLDRIDVVFVK